MFLFGVINASPDSLHTESICTTADAAVARAEHLLATGAQGIDIGGQGSTDNATVITWQDEWERLRHIVPAVAALGIPVSVDSWRPEVMRLGLEHGADVINGADGMQSDEMWMIAAEFEVPVVVPFLSGPNPREMIHVTADPLDALHEFFVARLAQAQRFGVRSRCILDPGTGFAPPNWPWEERYVYQKRVYENLDVLRSFGLPIYVALPWKQTAQHDELLEIVVRSRPDYGRAHDPAKVRRVEAAVLGATDDHD